MSNVHQVESVPPLRIIPARQDRTAPARDQDPAATESPKVDRVDISPSALNISNLTARGEIRADLVSRVRAEIANGTYVTPDKVDAAIDSLLSEFQG